MFEVALTWCLAVAALVIALALSLLLAWPSPSLYFAIQRLPGPPGLFYFGNGLSLALTPLEDVLYWFHNKINDFDRVVRLWIMGANLILIKKPDDVQVIMSSRSHIRKGIEYNTMNLWLNEGLLLSDGQKWHDRRKLLTPTFHFKVLEDSMVVLNKHGLDLAEKLSKTEGKPVAIEPFISHCTLDVICESAMGIATDSEDKSENSYVRNIQRICQLIVERFIHPWLFKDWMLYLSSTGREFLKVTHLLHRYTEKVIKERKAVVFSADDDQEDSSKYKRRKAFLDLLLEVERQNPGTLSDFDIREEVDTFMFEGHDTTSSALMFLMFNLGTYPEIQDKVYKELEDIFGDSDRDITMQDLQKMSYLEKVIKENLRIFPSVPYISRLLKESVQLSDGVLLPPKSNVVIMPFSVHRNPEIFPDPEKFDPERFSEEESANRHPFAYIPFSAGPRNCIGQKFAMAEIKSTIAWVLRKLKINTITKREEFKLLLSTILRSNAHIRCEFTPRGLQQ